MNPPTQARGRRGCCAGRSCFPRRIGWSGWGGLLGPLATHHAQVSGYAQTGGMANIRVEALLNGTWIPVQAIAPVPYDRENVTTFAPVLGSDTPREALSKKLESCVTTQEAVWVTFENGDSVLFGGAVVVFRIAKESEPPNVAWGG